MLSFFLSFFLSLSFSAFVPFSITETICLSVCLSVCLSLFLPFQPSLLFIAEIVASIGDCFFTVEKLCLKFAQKFFCFWFFFSKCFVGANGVVQLCSAVPSATKGCGFKSSHRYLLQNIIYC